MECSQGLTSVCLTAILALFGSTLFAEDALDRLRLERLAKQHDAISALRLSRQPVRVTRPYTDFRANLHVHSAFSHDSRGQIDHIVAAAKAAGTKVLMFTEHPAAHYDVFEDGHQGVRDGVLLVPGAEMKGFLVFPKISPRPFEIAEKQEFSNIIRGRGGLTFISHLEERMDWEISGVTGCEIYNTHADFKNEKRLVAALKNPLWLIQAKRMFDMYPQEALSALLDYPSDYLARFDKLCCIHPHTGVSANDAHQNVGLIVRLVEGNKVAVEDPLGDKLLELDRAVFHAIQPIPDGTPVGTELYRLQLDPYERSLRHVGTHLLMKDLSTDSVWESLNSGRCYVAFDWLGDATGFDYAVVAGQDRWEMGSQVAWRPGLKIQARAPHAAHWKVIKTGQVAHEAHGETIDWELAQPGIYRLEAWLDLAGSEQIWILSNPIYVQ